MPLGDRQPIELLLDEAAWAAEPVRLARERGHTPVDDTTNTERYTCTACGRAVLRCGVNIYGSAVENDCPATDAKETR